MRQTKPNNILKHGNNHRKIRTTGSHQVISPKEAGKATPRAYPNQAMDAVAYNMIKQELAPKGFTEIRTGAWKGKVRSNIDFLPQQSVKYCQNIAAQMVRTFREQAKLKLETQIGLAKSSAATLKWYQIREKWAYKGIIEALSGTLKELDNIEVPTK